MKRLRVIIMGAGGRDFHNFNVLYRDNPKYKVIAFTATQIPGIEGRIYLPELAGSLYHEGIRIFPEEELKELIKRFKIDLVLFSYSDVSYKYLEKKKSQIEAYRVKFVIPNKRLMKKTMLKSQVPIIAVTAVRTGCGKSPLTRKICQILKDLGKKIVVVRHPMPYGELSSPRAVQRFEKLSDLDKFNCTVEEREEYEPLINQGYITYAGIDYEKILRAAEKEAEIIIWDGGNNDTSFFKPNLQITVVDPLRAGHEIEYYPGLLNFQTADAIVINKKDGTSEKQLKIIMRNIQMFNSQAKVLEIYSPIKVDLPDIIFHQKVLIIEDGPTLTHGGAKYGAGWIAAHKYDAGEFIDAEIYAVGSIKEIYKKYPLLKKKILPALGYSKEQLKELEETINNSPATVVIMATPADLTKLIKIDKPVAKVSYESKEIGKNLENLIEKFSNKKEK